MKRSIYEVLDSLDMNFSSNVSQYEIEIHMYVEDFQCSIINKDSSLYFLF